MKTINTKLKTVMAVFLLALGADSYAVIAQSEDNNQVSVSVEQDKLNTKLINAAKAKVGGLIKVRLAHKLGADPNAKDNNGNTPLMHATWNGSEGIVQYLIDVGADIKARDKYGRDALIIAIIIGHKGIVHKLVTAGADINHATISGLTPLTVAAIEGNRSLVQYLINAGADPEAKCNEGLTPLMYAAFGGNESIFQVFKKTFQDLITPNLVKRFIKREEKDYRGIVQDLIAIKVNINARGKKGITALKIARLRKNEDIAQDLIDAGANNCKSWFSNFIGN